MPCDVFVSYARRDNSAPTGVQGFISRLVESVTASAQIKYGQDLEFWWDENLASGTLWEPEIRDKLATCQVFVPIVSRSWIASRWAGEEWDAVWHRVKEDKSLGNETRIIPVSFELDDGFRSTLPLKLRAFQFKRQFRNLLTKDEFDKQADGLADDIAKRVSKLAQRAGTTSVTSEQPSVFLGIALSPEMNDWRQRVKDELDNRGHRVHEVRPDWAWTEEAVSQNIERELRESDLAVHFLEDNPGPSFASNGRPLVQIQCEAGLARGGDAFNLFWVGPVLKTKSERYPAFTKTLDYTNDSVDVFVGSLLNRLCELAYPKEPDPPRTIPLIWLICESGDHDVAGKIVAGFAKLGWPVMVPGLNVSQASYCKGFREDQYFLFYWGHGGKDWCFSNCEELIDSRRRGGGFNPPYAVLMYCGEEKLVYKEQFTWLWPKCPAYDQFELTAPEVQAFITRVKSTWQTQVFPQQSTA